MTRDDHDVGDHADDDNDGEDGDSETAAAIHAAIHKSSGSTLARVRPRPCSPRVERTHGESEGGSASGQLADG